MPLTTKQGSGEKRKRAWARRGEGERILLSLLLCGYCLPINFSEDVSLMASFVKSPGSYSLIRAHDGDVRPAKVCFPDFVLNRVSILSFFFFVNQGIDLINFCLKEGIFS